MPLNFPSSPTNGQTYTSGGRSWTYDSTSGSWLASTGANTLANKTNPLAPRGGVAFDGTGNSRVYSTLTNQNIGTDDFSVVFVGKVPTSLPAVAAGAWYVGASSSESYSSSVALSFQSTGELRCTITNSAASGGMYFDIASFQQTYSGKTVQIAFVRNTSGSPSLYINGEAKTISTTTFGSSPGDFTQSVTSTYLGVGYIYSTYLWNAPIYSCSLYNLALTAADVQEIYELNGAVPEKYKNTVAGVNKWASQVSVSDVSLSIGSFTGSVSGNVITASTSSTGYVYANIVPYPNWRNVRGYQRLKYDLVVNSGATPSLDDANSFNAALPAGTGKMVEINNTGFAQLLIVNNYAATDFVFTFTSLTRIGCVLHLPLNDGAGLTLRDQSTNSLDATMTSTGVSHVLPNKVLTTNALQFPAATSVANGITFGTDCFLYREATNQVTLQAASSAQTGIRFLGGGSGAVTVYAAGSNAFTISSSLAASFLGTTASTSTTTGSLVNAGGFGNAGNLYVGGGINASNGTTAGTTGLTILGNSGSNYGFFSYSSEDATTLSIDNAFDSVSSAITMRVRTLGTPVETFRTQNLFTFVNNNLKVAPVNYTQNAWGEAGATFNIAGATITDGNTAASGTAASATFNSFQASYLAATNSNVTTTDAANVFIANAPLTGANQTITNSWGLWNKAKTRLDGALQTNAGRQVANAAKTGDYTLTTADDFVYYTSTGGHTFTLYTPTSNAGRRLMIKNRGTGNLTIASNSGSQLFDGAAVASVILAVGESVYLICDGTYFNIL